MVEYSFAEYTDMFFLYGEARGNGRNARRLYQDRFSQRSTPSYTLSAIILQRLRETGTFTASSYNCGVPRKRRTLKLEEAVGTMCARSCWSPLDVYLHEATFQHHNEHQKPMIGCKKIGTRTVCANVLYFLDGPRSNIKLYIRQLY